MRLVPPARALWRAKYSTYREMNEAAAARAVALKASVWPWAGAGTTNGQFLVRIVWSGVTTPAWL